MKAEKNCPACAFSFMGPGDDELVCGHKDTGPVGEYARFSVLTDAHCGPDRAKFQQHPLRNPDGSLP